MQYMDDYIAYFQHLASIHPIIQHQEVEGFRSFSAIYMEEILNDFRSQLREKAFTLHAIRYSSRINSDSSSATLDRLGGFIVMGHADTGDYPQRAAMESTCEQICIDLLLRIQADSANGHPLFLYSQDLLNRITMKAYENRITSSYAGFIVTFDMRSAIEHCNEDTRWMDGSLISDHQSE